MDNGTATQIPRISLTPDEAAVSTGFSRTRIFKAIRDNRLIARGDGKATIIEVEELARWVRSLPAKGRSHQAADRPPMRSEEADAPTTLPADVGRPGALTRRKIGDGR
jgi:hypothetical protein